MTETLIIRQLGLQPYDQILKKMHCFTNKRNSTSKDEIWLVQHPPVFTQGRSSKDKNLFNLGLIPIIKTDRGGQITFHGPGQQLMYVLLDLRRRKLKVRNLILLLEQSVVTTLSHYAIYAYARIKDPGVYVGNNKICSLGLSIIKGCSLHGIALNIKMDLSPFLYINPCGNPNLHMTQVSNLSSSKIDINSIASLLVRTFIKQLSIINNT